MKNLADVLLKSNSILVFTGAGVSAESGIPTFRDPEGIWAKFSPEELASREGFQKDPIKVSNWYLHRRNIIRNVQPNPGHYAITQLQNLLSNVNVVTQNVDGLHQKAGTKNVIELHGNIFYDKCFQCEKYYSKEYDEKEYTNLRCECGGRIRPAVVWFGELLPYEEFSRAEHLAETCETMLIVGTQASVYPAAGLVHIAKYSHATLIEINPSGSEVSPYCKFVIRQPSGIALPKIIEEITELMK
ncbi:MAG: NAD-dependent deacylase [bacterium]|nr:NAD-dependent deacylase [bacterium]